ncbi:MAG TPA: NAD-dependent epimerase/dehydratase family protein [Stellaceae bacterium]|nr:NAD-dependent epimerase/dehydratase family protein [Stellaceae bacterium]
MARILVTGAAGFIGSALCRGLAARGHTPIAGLRRPAAPSDAAEGLLLGDIAPGRDWSRALRGTGIEIVIHLAQRAHRAADPAALAPEPAAAAALAGAAARAGAKRFVYVSSILALGDETAPGRPFRSTDAPHPAGAYGRAKLATEEALTAAAPEAGIELAILRLPPVHGPGVRANFHALMRLVASGVPLPFAAIDNRRSFIFLDNLVDIVAVAASHPAAPGGIWLVRDDPDLSTPELICALSAGLGRPGRLFPVPEALWPLLQSAPRIGPRIAALTRSLQADDGATRAAFGWTPPVPTAEGLARTARAFVAESRSGR